MQRRLWVLLLLAALLPAQRGGGKAMWEHVKKTYDKDGDGKVTETEYTRGKRGFTNLDKDGDGTITADDFKRGSRGGRGPSDDKISETARRLGDLFGSFINVDGQPGISRKDWAALKSKLKPADDGTIASENLAAVMGKAGKGRMGPMANGRLRRILDTDGDRKVTVEEVDALFTELDLDQNGTIDVGTEIIMPPGVGEIAPDFTLPFADDSKKTVTLSSFRGKKPVCLIFGSYT